MDFFNSACQEASREDILFGICDDDDSSVAYSKTDDQNTWIATVNNEHQKPVTFTAVDKCIIKQDEEFGRGRCDGMITFDSHLFFIELKDQRKNWLTGAIEQLESTIQFFLEAHPATAYKHKKAFACNKKRPHFHEIDNEQNLRFFREYGFRLDVQSNIIIV